MVAVDNLVPEQVDHGVPVTGPMLSLITLGKGGESEPTSDGATAVVRSAVARRFRWWLPQKSLLEARVDFPEEKWPNKCEV